MSMNERLHALIKRADFYQRLAPYSRPNTLKLGNSAQTNTVVAECLYDEIGPRLRLLGRCQLAFPVQSGCNKAPDEDEDMRGLYYD